MSLMEQSVAVGNIKLKRKSTYFNNDRLDTIAEGEGMDDDLGYST